MHRVHPGLVMVGTYGIISLVLGWFLLQPSKAQPFDSFNNFISTASDSLDGLIDENTIESISESINENFDSITSDSSVHDADSEPLDTEYDELVVDWLVEKGGEVGQYLQSAREADISLAGIFIVFSQLCHKYKSFL